MKKETNLLCDENCNNCPIIRHPNSVMVTFVMNKLGEEFGFDKLADIINKLCPNLTCCFDCRSDDFCHFTDCEIAKLLEDGYNIT